MGMNFQFNTKKSTQAGAFLLKANGGQMDKYLWIKMLYLADRKALQKWCESITGDSPASLRYGPVLETIYDLTKGQCSSLREYWEMFISDADAEANQIRLKADPGTDELSRAEIKILQSVFDECRNFDFSRMRDYCHNLPEYEDVGAGSKPLPIERILKAIGKTDEAILEAERMHNNNCLADMLLSRST
jgi:hypothetical protein